MRTRAVPGDLSQYVFRTSRDHELLVFDRMSAREIRLVGEQADEPDLYGVFRSRADGAMRVVDRDMALLLFTLQRSGALPRFLRREFEPRALRRWVRGLLADGILELAHRDRFLSRAEALAVLEGEETAPVVGSRLNRLSLTALEHASALPGWSRAGRSRCLYEFNRRPKTPTWRSRLPADGAVAAWLGLDADIGARWDLCGRRGAAGGWLGWSSGDRESAGDAFKLYVSPLPDDLPAAVELLTRPLGRLRARHWKIANRRDGVLRPDKLVLYFDDLESLKAAAEVLSNRLAALRPQGVPFTADAGLDGLLSWGADPPAARLTSWRPRTSWRSWLADRLAEAIADALERGEAEPWRPALDSLALEGVDTTTWAPDPVRWSAA